MHKIIGFIFNKNSMGMPPEFKSEKLDKLPNPNIKLGGDSILINIDNNWRDISGKEEKSAALTTVPQPLKLEVESATDWAIVVVGVAGIFSSIIIAKYTSSIQKNQIRSNVANMRQKWLEDVRQAAVDFVEMAVLMVNHIGDDEKYLSSREGSIDFGKLLAANARLNMMLDMKHRNNKEIIKISDDLILLIGRHSKPGDKLSEIRDETTEKLDTFQVMMREVLEQAWLDIKNDLQAKSSNWLGRFGK